MKTLLFVIIAVFSSQASFAKKLTLQTPTPTQERDTLCEDTDELALQQIIVDAEVRAAKSTQLPSHLAKIEKAVR